MVGAGGKPLFPFSWTPDPKAIARVESHVLPPLDRKVIHTLECFRPLECIILIARDSEDDDSEDDNRVKEYVGGGTSR
ncbi:unnamed protein product [Lathyrus oleraceus]